MAQIPVKKLSTFVEQQLPDWIKEQDPTFISFLEAYYEWLEESGNLVERSFSFIDLKDIDTTIDQFVDYFQHEFIPNIPKSVLTNKRTLIKHIKDFYRAKGSEKSYRFLFRIVFNEDIDFYYPKLDLIKPSDGKWYINRIIRTTTINNTFDFISHRIQGVDSGASASVENVIQFNLDQDVISEWYLSDISGTFIAGEKINVFLSGNTIKQELLYGLVQSKQINNPGLRYKTNDIVNITGGGGTNASALVEEVGGSNIGRVVSATFLDIPDPSFPDTVTPANITLENKTAVLKAEINDTGNISAIRIIKKGRNYVTTPSITFGGPGSGAIATAILDELGRFDYITIDNAGSGYTTVPTISVNTPVADDFFVGMFITIESGPGAGQTRRITNYDSSTNLAEVDSDWDILPTVASIYNIILGKITKIKIRDFGVKYTSIPTADVASDTVIRTTMDDVINMDNVLDMDTLEESNFGGNGAEVSAKIGALGSYPGVFLNTDGFLDSNKYLPDDRFYQDFSYVIKSGVSVNSYRDMVKKLLHPAGTALFGEILIETQLPLVISFRNFERNKFFYPPYKHYGKYFQVNVGDPEEFSNPRLDYIGERQSGITWDTETKTWDEETLAWDDTGLTGDFGNWTDSDGVVWNYTGHIIEPYGYGDTQAKIWKDEKCGNIISFPNTKKSQISDSYIKIIKVNRIFLPQDGLIAEYDCLRGVDYQTLYDVKLGLPKYDGTLGRSVSFEDSDPTYTDSGLFFSGARQYATCGTFQIQPLSQSILIVAKCNDLTNKQSIIGSIDTASDGTITGYSIEVNPGGSINFRAQKFNGTPHSIIASYPTNTVRAGQWFFCALRYFNNKVTANFDIIPSVSKSFLTNIDGTSIQNNSNGYILGNQGYLPLLVARSLYGASFFGSSLYAYQFVSTTVTTNVDSPWGAISFGDKSWGGLSQNDTQFTNIPYSGNFLNGNIAYVTVYDKAIGEDELNQAYEYIKAKVSDRDIFLP